MLVAQGLIKDLVCYLYWRKNYKNQGIPYDYIPFVGLVYFFIIELHPIFENLKPLDRFKVGFIKKVDIWAKFRQLGEKRKGNDIIAINYRNQKPILHIMNPDLVAELFNQDNDSLVRDLPVHLPIDLGFFTQQGPHALQTRSIFAKFFYPQHLENYTPKILKIIETRLQRLSQDFKNSKLVPEYPEGYSPSGKAS